MSTVEPPMLREMPEEERPREKLLSKGAEALSNVDLLAIILHTGMKSESVIHLAERVLSQTNGLARLSTLSAPELCKVKGIGLAKAVSIVATFELSRRLAALSEQERTIIHSPRDVALLVMPRLRYLTKEHFLILLLSTKNHVLAQPTISIGSLSAAVVHPREVFREAINYSAAGIILVHNHPSGDPLPSQEDISLTKKLVEAGKMLDIIVLDHVIIGDGKYVSFKEKGIIE